MKYNSEHHNNSYQRKNTISDSVSTFKPLEELTMMDSFLFEASTENVENAKIIAKAIIERCTGHKVKHLVVQTQKQLKGINTNSRGR